MSNEDIAEAFELVRDNSSPLVHPLIDSLERMSLFDREAIAAINAKVQLLDAMLERRQNMLERAT